MIDDLPDHWSRRTQNAYAKIPTHQRRQHHETTNAGTTEIDVHLTEDRHLQSLPTTIETTTEGRNNGTISFCIKIRGRFLSIRNIGRRIIRKHLYSQFDRPRHTKRST